MKKYYVTFRIGDREMIKGEKPWSEVVEELDQEVQAEDEREAIILAIDYIAECLPEYMERYMDRYHTYDINDDYDEITIYNADGEAVELYYDFEAEEIAYSSTSHYC